MQAATERGYSHRFVIVSAIFVTALLTANIAAVKVVWVFGLAMPAGIVVFPISYIVGDVLTEVYGYREARRVIWLGFLCNLLLVAGVWVGKVLPPAPFWGISRLRRMILSKSARTSGIASPNSLPRRASSYISALLRSDFTGMQPAFRQTPPRRSDCSTRAVSRPACAARMAAV